MDPTRHITVYGASSSSLDGRYYAAARAVGRAAALAGATIVTGGGRSGMMGAVTDGCLEAGGRVRGVIPSFMVERGWHHPGLTHMDTTAGMHPRKELMAGLSRDTGVIALPGGIGTLDELMEIMTWRQLGLYHGNIVLLDTLGYWQPLKAMLDHAVAQGMMRPDCTTSLYDITGDPGQAVDLALRPVRPRQFAPKF